MASTRPRAPTPARQYCWLSIQRQQRTRPRLSGMTIRGLEASPRLTRQPRASARALPSQASQPARATPVQAAAGDPRQPGRVRCWTWLLAQQYWRAGVALVSRATPREHMAYLESVGVPWIEAGADRVDLPAALEALARAYGVRHVRADCGGTLNGALLRAGLVSTVSVLIQPDPRRRHDAEGALPRRRPHVRRPGDRAPTDSRRAAGRGVVWLVYEVEREAEGDSAI